MINPARLIDTFIELARIDSLSGDEQQIAEHIAGRLRSAGATAHVDLANNVTATLPGWHVPASARPYFLSAHMDNVAPARAIRPVVEDGRISSDGTTVLGADDLAGVAAILEAVTALRETNQPHVPLEIAITTQEEVGLVGAKSLDLSGFRAKEGVVLDGEGPVGALTVATPTHNLIQVIVTGRAAHSAAHPEDGINAIRIASTAISALRLGRLDHETTANVGIIRGGTARNIIPEQVQVAAETRSRNLVKLERATRAMRAAFEKAARASGAQVDFQVTRAYNGYTHRRGDPAVQRVAAALRSIGIRTRYVKTMGGSDANVWNAKGIKTVVASVGYEQMHTVHEFIPVPELVRAAQLAEALARPVN
jgi:tripeptide aminopeptidase